MALSTDIKRYGMYYIVGYGTESSGTSSTKFNQLSYAGKDNSGLSFGITQVDISKYSDILRIDFANAYNTWLSNTGRDVSNLSITAASLTVTKTEAEKFLSSERGKVLNEYLATSDGTAFVRQWDSDNVGKKVDNLGNALAGTKFFNTLNDEQQFIVYTIAAKVSNQTGNANKMLNLLNGNPTQANDTAPWFTMVQSDSPEQIVQKLVDYTQTYSSTTARADALKAYTKASSFYDLYSSDAFSDAHTFLQDINNNIEGFGANSTVTMQLSILRALSADSNVNLSSGTLSYSYMKTPGWIQDPLTKNQIWVDNQVVVVLDQANNCSGIFSRSENTWLYSMYGEEISSNGINIKPFSNGNMLVDSNGDYYLIKDNINVEISHEIIGGRAKLLTLLHYFNRRTLPYM